MTYVIFGVRIRFRILVLKMEICDRIYRVSTMISCERSIFSALAIWFGLSMMIFQTATVYGSVLTVENGVYRRLTVRVNDEVDKCHCDRVIENTQVRNLLLLSKVFMGLQLL